MTGICICIMIKNVDHYLSYIHFIRDFCNDQDKIEILLYNKLNKIYIIFSWIFTIFSNL